MHQNAHILAVDDDSAIRSLIVEYLTENGLRVSPAGNGVEMHAVLDSDHVDLIVLDVKLPGRMVFRWRAAYVLNRKSQSLC